MHPDSDTLLNNQTIIKYLCMYIFIYVYICVYIHMCVCVCVCIYILNAYGGIGDSKQPASDKMSSSFHSSRRIAKTH
jgi:hypothetical protein